MRVQIAAMTESRRFPIAVRIYAETLAMVAASTGIGLVIAPLAVYWAWRRGMRRRVYVWAFAMAAYALGIALVLVVLRRLRAPALVPAISPAAADATPTEQARLDALVRNDDR